MTGWLSSIPILGKLFGDTTEIIKEAVLDKDAQNKIIETLDVLKQNVEREIYIRELDTKTIPWVDALHKMGRQILNIITIAAVTVLLLNDIQITGPVAMILGGGNLAYQIVKGPGKK
jgi:membrane-bound ClpP family serine protease